jgi:hypothetical protein
LLPGPASSHNSKEEIDKANKKHNPINNPINNPIFAQRRKEVSDLENRKAIDDLGLGHIMRSKTETEGLCEHLLSVKTYAILGNLTMRQAIETNSFAIYIGTTKRALIRRGPRAHPHPPPPPR